jgi:molybdopterin-synthase adenylyltransferase
MSDASDLLIARPVRLVQVEGGVVLKRGCTEMVVMGEAAGSLITSIMSRAVEGGITRQQLHAEAGVEYESSVDQLVDGLLARRLLTPVGSNQVPTNGPEGPEDVYYWHYETTQPEVTERLNEVDVVVVGRNVTCHAICRSLAMSGIRGITIIDEPTLKNERCLTDSWKAHLPTSTTLSVISPISFDPAVLHNGSPYIVAASDCGAQECLRVWNAKCVQSGWPFFPVVLHNLLGCVGPLSIPGQTACYECLRARQNSHLCDPLLQRAAESDSHAVAAYHPSMAEIIGNIAGLQLAGFISRFGLAKAGNLTTMNFITSEMVTRRVLRVPRCSVCGRLNQYATTTPLKSVFMPGNAQ